ncbi:helix-turn-helix domain-containing protein [Pelosinus propionicus]|uniref:Helix-turn-helix domain-containing protein n=1 Tax=Pelosinus propionicus DSM 13327 TaxID=1123291 RepID=A0A1I4N8I3_9FIRM|nr:helix-turn-helix domain-containing protein [Pelosinus propionicus]SFM11553.1 Helix-turn-helix domain-containing protein [Pelosinus propionicus DSM 13327]
MGYCTDIWCIEGISFHAKGIYCLLAKFVNKEGTCWPTIDTMQKISGLSRPTIIKSIKELETNGDIKVTKRFINGMKFKSLYYLVNLDKREVKEIYNVVNDVDHGSKGDLPTVVNDVYSNLSNNNLSINNEEQVIIDFLQEVQGYPFKIETDLNFIRELKKDFPMISIIEKLKDWKVWLIKKPLTKKSNARSQIRNWMKPKKWEGTQVKNAHSAFKKEEWGY